MKTRISCRRNRCYELIVDGPKKAPRQVLAGMTLFEGTGLWMLTDIRLHQYRKVSPYSGGLFCDDIHSSYTPKNEDDSKFVQSLLREFTIDEDGTIHWSTFEGLVRGTPAETPYCWNNGVGYFTRAEGLAELKRIQAFWDQYEGDPDYAKVDNPHRQPSEMSISMKIWIRDEKLGLIDDEDEPEGLALRPSPPPPPLAD